MASFRKLKAEARRALHRKLKVSAHYFAPDSVVPALCDVRVHTKLNKQQGDLAGTNFSYAEQEEHIPALLFWRSQIDPENRAVVMISPSEGYRVNHVRQPDGLTTTAEVVQLTALERSRYTAPANPDGVEPQYLVSPDDSDW